MDQRTATTAPTAAHGRGMEQFRGDGKRSIKGESTRILESRFSMHSTFDMEGADVI
jgi:hypothetical protein